MTTYETMIREAAERLAAAMRAAPYPRDVCVWSIATTETANGRLHVGADYPAEAGDKARSVMCVRPLGYPSWATVPFSMLRQILTESCRREPILPLEG